jgi:hypothetical protein
MPRNSRIGEVDAEVCSPITIARLPKWPDKQRREHGD